MIKKILRETNKTFKNLKKKLDLLFVNEDEIYTNLSLDSAPVKIDVI